MAPRSSNLDSNQPGNLSGNTQRSSLITSSAKGQTLFSRLIFKLTPEQLVQKIEVLLPRKQGTDAYQAEIVDSPVETIWKRREENQRHRYRDRMGGWTAELRQSASSGTVPAADTEKGMRSGHLCA